jgi:molybdopterin-guanine dinucleotide biosynthesis adapter protein
MAAIISFIGWHDSGKTTLATQVVRHLKDFGYKVAVIKSSDETGITFDTPGTDTFKHRQAGADSILLVAPDQMVLQTRNNNLSLTSLVHRYFQDVDIIIGEGFKGDKKVSKIEVVRDPSKMLRDKAYGVIAVATDQDISGDNIFRLDEAKEIASFIREKFLKDREQPTDTVSLLVNGNKIPLNGFVKEALAGTVAGFIKSLKFVDDASEIELSIKMGDSMPRP